MKLCPIGEERGEFEVHSDNRISPYEGKIKLSLYIDLMKRVCKHFTLNIFSSTHFSPQGGVASPVLQ